MVYYSCSLLDAVRKQEHGKCGGWQDGRLGFGVVCSEVWSAWRQASGRGLFCRGRRGARKEKCQEGEMLGRKDGMRDTLLAAFACISGCANGVEHGSWEVSAWKYGSVVGGVEHGS